MPEVSFRIAIADDDEPIRNLLKSYLNSYEEVEVVGVAADGAELVQIVREKSPDAVFVDIQMPGLNGLSVVYRLQQEFPSLFVVFVSAYPQYAVDAFNLDAVDFLAKPVTRDRLGKALNKLKRFNKFLCANGGDQAPAAGKGTGSSGRLALKSGHGITVIEKNSILFIEKQGKRSVIHTTRGQYEISYTLARLEKLLKEPNFFRCHKSFIINVRMVERIAPYADRAYEVSFFNYPEKATMRREKFEEFCSLIAD